MLLSSSAKYPRFAADTFARPVKAFISSVAFEVGTMRNVSRSSALGSTLVLGADQDGVRYGGAKLRYRRWLNPNGLALDVAGGVAFGSLRGLGRSAIVTSDVSLNFADNGALLTRVELAHARGRTQSALSGGGRVGSQPGLILGGLAALASLAYWVGTFFSWGDT